MNYKQSRDAMQFAILFLFFAGIGTGLGITENTLHGTFIFIISVATSYILLLKIRKSGYKIAVIKRGEEI